jgi:hypothetical protein
VTTLVIDRGTLPESLSSLFQTPRVKVKIPRGGGKATITPTIDADDYENIEDYIDAVPGLREKLIAGANAPDSECIEAPADWISDGV